MLGFGNNTPLGELVLITCYMYQGKLPKKLVNLPIYHNTPDSKKENTLYKIVIQNLFTKIQKKPYVTTIMPSH